MKNINEELIEHIPRLIRKTKKIETTDVKSGTIFKLWCLIHGISQKDIATPTKLHLQCIQKLWNKPAVSKSTASLIVAKIPDIMKVKYPDLTWEEVKAEFPDINMTEEDLITKIKTMIEY
ncbi:MAG: hypothetical protein AABY22_24835 [Nanoarchaeota archaeon]